MDDVVFKAVLERFQLTLNHAIPKHWLEHFGSMPEFDTIVDQIGENVVLRFRTHVLGERIGTISYPADWWEAFKERWFPEWLKRRYPVRYVTYDVRAFYPNISLPEHQPYVIFVKTT